jgi:hypothetical protein
MRFPHSLVLATCIALLPIGTAVGQGAGSSGSGGVTGTSAGGAGAAGAGDRRGGAGVGDPPRINSNDIGGTHASPPISGQTQPPMAPAEVRGIAEESPSSSTGLAKPAEDGIATKIVPARPCSTAARETDGTTTCVGIPGKR